MGLGVVGDKALFEAMSTDGLGAIHTWEGHIHAHVVNALNEYRALNPGAEINANVVNCIYFRLLERDDWYPVKEFPEEEP